MKHCMCLFLCMGVRQCYGKWRRDLELGVYRLQMDNLRGLLGIRRMDRVSNARIMELCGMKKGLDERIDEGVFRCFGHVERIAKECVLVVVQWVGRGRDALIP